VKADKEAFRMETLIDHAWARWGVLVGPWTHRFAPVLAPLRCARPVVLHGCREPGSRVKLQGMKDIQLYQQILGLVEPWRVESVTLKPKEQEIEVRVGFADTLWGCPQCQKRMQIHDYEERRWRHLDSCQFQTIIVSRVPSVRCPEHGSQTVAVPWAEKYTRFTRLFERLAIDVMLECSITGACELLRISWDEGDGIKQRAVKRGLARKSPAVMPHLCVDEKGMGPGQNYLTIVAQVTDERTTVEYVGEERERESLDAFWEGLTAEQLAGVEAVAMDMWEPYVQSTLAHVPGAAGKIVHDPFHLVKYMNEAVNEVRKSEHRRLQAQGDDILKNTRQLWLYGMERVPAQHAQRFETVKELNLQTSRAWMIKEVFRGFWLCDQVKEAERYFQKWYRWAIRSRLQPVKKVARMCQTHLGNILTFFVHRLTNGPIEGLNNKIQGLIKKAFGYRNKKRFKADIFFHLGGLDLYPIQ
jgi:transposase